MSVEYATILFSSGEEYTKEITEVEPLASHDGETGATIVTIVAETCEVTSGIAMTITKERWRELSKEIEEMITALEEGEQTKGFIPINASMMTGKLILPTEKNDE